jgi:hypothetical protein
MGENADVDASYQISQPHKKVAGEQRVHLKN